MGVLNNVHTVLWTALYRANMNASIMKIFLTNGGAIQEGKLVSYNRLIEKELPS